MLGRIEGERRKVTNFFSSFALKTRTQLENQTVQNLGPRKVFLCQEFYLKDQRYALSLFFAPICYTLIGALGQTKSGGAGVKGTEA